MANLIALLHQYETLTAVASFLSTIDLFHLALTKSELYTLILKSEHIFNRLVLCDGRGLEARQEFKGLYKVDAKYCSSGNAGSRKVRYDEELEVRLEPKMRLYEWPSLSQMRSERL
jgi:hypothetical protein